MSLVTITEAARLTNKSTQTLYRHIKAGKLSRNANSMIDTAELIRVYGELKPIDTHAPAPSHDTLPHHDIDIITLLQQQITKLESDLHELKAESLERERQGIEREKRLMALIENSRQEKQSLFGKLFK